MQYGIMITNKVQNVIHLLIHFNLYARIWYINNQIIQDFRIYILDRKLSNLHNRCIQNGCKLKDFYGSKFITILKKIKHILELVMINNKKVK